MENLIEKIWSYGHLSEEEKAELEAFVVVNTQYAPVLDDSKALHNVLKEAGVFASDTIDDVAIAYLVAHRQIRSGVAPGVLEHAYKQLQQKIETMPQALERYSEVQVRMEEIALKSNPLSQFEELTGYNVEQDFENSEEAHPKSLRRFVGDRAGVKRQKVSRSHLLFKGGSVVIVGCLMLLTLGYYTNRVSRIAYTGADVLLVSEAVEERGVEQFNEPVSPDVVFTQAQRTLFESQHIWAGIYYSFDEDKLATAEQLFMQVREDPLSSPFLKEESAFLLAKVYLAQRDFSGADTMLAHVIKLRGRRMEDALRLQALM